MPYRRLPKTDNARLKALRTLLDNNDIYTVRNRFVDWKDLNRAQPAYDKLLTAIEQIKVCKMAQRRSLSKLEQRRRKAALYVSHFAQVLFMAVERGEIRRQYIGLYGLDGGESLLVPTNIHTNEGLLEQGKKLIDGEKERIKRGGRPIYNPSIGMVGTHYDIFVEAYHAHQRNLERTARAYDGLDDIRASVDDVLLTLWNQIEKPFEQLPWDQRMETCRKFGIVYYLRRKEKKKQA